MAEPIKLASKFGQITEILKKAIEAGDFGEGQRVTSENELSRKYGISRNTVREAISSLVQQGYLTRKQGKGTFVTNRRPQVHSSHAYAIIIQAQGHVHEGETRALVRAFQQHKAIPIVFDVREIKGDKQIRDILTKLLERGLDGVVLEDGVSEILIDLCQSTGHRLPAIAVLNEARRRTLPAKYVLMDIEHGTRIGTEHLLRLGRRRILFIIHRYLFLEPGATLDQVPGLYGDAIRGYQQALKAAGLAGQEQFLLVDREFSQGALDATRLKALLTGPDRPDAIFAFGDNRAKHAIDIAAEVGLRVPEDLAVIGFWNTPWAEMTRVPLTSVSVREEEVAQIAVEKLLAESAEGVTQPEVVILPPELVVRASCGATLSGGT